MLSISSTIVFARLAHSNEFAPMRVMLTFGWMAGGVLVSLLNADTSIARRLHQRDRYGWCWRHSLFFCRNWKSPSPPKIFRGMNGSASTR